MLTTGKTSTPIQQAHQYTELFVRDRSEGGRFALYVGNDHVQTAHDLVPLEQYRPVVACTMITFSSANEGGLGSRSNFGSSLISTS